MNEPLQPAGWPGVDHPWQRLLWVVPISLLLWMLLLVGFSALVNRHRQAPAPVRASAPLEAQMVYLPPAAGTPHAPAAAAPPKPAIARPLPPKPVHRVRHVVQRSPLAIPHPARKAAPQAAPAAPSKPGTTSTAAVPPAHGGAGTGAPGGASGLGMKGLGGPSMGARATYAPLPEIPDDLREEGFEGVAVAHFQVDHDGKASVTLSQPTSDPSLNGLLLATLKRWRFLPAVKDGIAVDSVFDIRIPIQVQ